MTSSLRLSVCLAGLICLALPSLADPAGTADSRAKKEAGPNRGRVLDIVEPRAEFFVTPERNVQITFLDRTGKPVPPSGQTVTVTAGDRLAPTRLSFMRVGDVLISEQTLPPGNRVPAVVQITPTAEAKAAVARFTVDLAVCPDCENAEYACVCAH